MMRCEDCKARSAALYAGADPDEMALVERTRIDVRAVPGGRMIIENEAECRYLFTVKMGWAYRFLLLADGRRQILDIYREGDLLTPGVLFGARTQGVVRALGEVLLCRFDRQKLKEIFEARPRFRDALFERCARQKERCDRHRLLLGVMTAEEAVSALILEIADGGNEPDGRIHFPLRLNHIADMLGMTEIHAGRVLRGLENAGAIRREGNRKLRFDRARLRAVLDGKKSQEKTGS